MAKPDFYNQNLYRDYPFRSQYTPAVLLESASSASAAPSSAYAVDPLPHASIVDFGVTMLPGAGFVDGRDWVYLHTVSRVDPYVLLEFKTSATEDTLRFALLRTAPAFTYTWQTNQDGYVYPDSSGSTHSLTSAASWWLGCEAITWQGFVVAGDLTDIDTFLTDGETALFDPGFMVIEPARIQNLAQTHIRSVNAAVQARTRVLHPPLCFSNGSSVSLGGDSQDDRYYQTALCLQGPIELREGYNCRIRQDDVTNTLTIETELGAGAGEVCNEFPYYSWESVGSSDGYFTGGPHCGKIYRSINGVGGSRVRIEGGTGIRVYTDEYDPSKIIIELALADAGLCTVQDSSSSSG